MLTLLLALSLHVGPAPAEKPQRCPVTSASRQGRRIRRPCASEGVKCDTLPCCPHLRCVEEIVGKVCRKPEEKG